MFKHLSPLPTVYGTGREKRTDEPANMLQPCWGGSAILNWAEPGEEFTFILRMAFCFCFSFLFFYHFTSSYYEEGRRGKINISGKHFKPVAT